MSSRMESATAPQSLFGLWRKLFIEHPADGGENYFQHLWFTASMSARFVAVSVILLVHGLLPFLFVHTASSRIEKIYRIMSERARRAQSGGGQYDI